MTDWHPYSHGRQRQATVWVAVISTLVAFAWNAACQAFHWTAPWWVDTPAVFGFYGLLYWAYDGYLWRTRFFRGLHGVPDINGTYVVRIRSSHDRHERDHEAKAIISQSWSRIVVRLVTASSVSKSDGAWLTEASGMGFRLTYTYANAPKSAAEPALTSHVGTAVITFSDDGQGDGEYYTGRGRMTQGALTFERERQAASSGHSAMPAPSAGP